MEKRAGREKSELTVYTSDYARRISGKRHKKLYAQANTYVNSAHSPNSARGTASPGEKESEKKKRKRKARKREKERPVYTS